MSTQKHTPVPWHVIRCDNGDYTISYSDTELRSHIATCHEQTLCPEHGSIEANAAFIVRACNSHTALLEACKALVEADDRSGDSALIDAHSQDGLTDDEMRYADAVRQARAAIAQAEKE